MNNGLKFGKKKVGFKKNSILDFVKKKKRCEL